MTKTKAVPGNALIPAAALALLFSLSLFGLMYSVIKAGHGALEKKDALPTIDFVRLKRDSEVESLSRHKPPPPPPAPPPPSKMKVVSDAVAQASLSGLEIPNLNLKADVSGEAMIGNKASAAALFDGELIPLNCPPPVTPSDARRAGLTGWVMVEVVVAPDGSPRSVKAVDAQPKGVFEAAAVMALQRCKFKPTVKDGVPVQQTARRKYNFGVKGAE
jgi:protein TonB